MFLDLCYCFLHFFIIYFCSELYGFFPSTNFGVFCSSFSSCFRDMVTSFIWYFSHFLRQTCIAISFSLSTAFGAPLRFWVFIVMCFWFFFFNFLLFLQWPLGYLETYCLASMLFFFFSFSVYLISKLIVLRSLKCLIWFQCFCIYQGLICDPRCDLFWRMFHVLWEKKKLYSAAFGCNVL